MTCRYCLRTICIDPVAIHDTPDGLVITLPGSGPRTERTCPCGWRWVEDHIRHAEMPGQLALGEAA